MRLWSCAFHAHVWVVRGVSDLVSRTPHSHQAQGSLKTTEEVVDTEYACSQSFGCSETCCAEAVTALSEDLMSVSADARRAVAAEGTTSGSLQLVHALQFIISVRRVGYTDGGTRYIIRSHT